VPDAKLHAGTTMLNKTERVISAYTVVENSTLCRYRSTGSSQQVRQRTVDTNELSIGSTWKK
jgi:hypothetical protein